MKWRVIVAKDARWQFWIDRGGTFTDVVARKPDGQLVTHKLLSDNPEQYQDAAMEGVRRLLGDDDVLKTNIAAIKMGTTVATNALLERKGDRTLLLTTRGFSDALRIAYQNRPRLFDLEIKLPELLHEKVVEIEERIDAKGKVLLELNEGQARAEMQTAYEGGIRSVAILLMHGYRYTSHELQLRRIAEEIGFPQISVSHEVSPLMKLVGRGDTTVLDAYLSPVLSRYIDGVAAEVNEVPLMFMQSNGGLTDARNFRGKDAILSGPAGGVVGMVRTAEAAGLNQVIGFDMGGTSTDVSHYNGEFERTLEKELSGVRIRAPMMHIHTVAAGGGSVLTYDGARFRVGPDSAGANPGPACYRRGGPLTVTDCNVMLGKIQPDHFPKVFGPSGDEPLDAEVVRTLFMDLVEAKGGGTVEQVAEGFLTIAVENMANAIKEISVQRGYDVTEYALSCFGGAGGQHACLVADALGITTVFIHPFAGVLSAYGMGLADISAMKEVTVELPLTSEVELDLEKFFVRLEREALVELASQGIPETSAVSSRKVHVRYEGTNTAIPVADGSAEIIEQSFLLAHQQLFGFIDEKRRMVIETITVEMVCAMDRVAEAAGRNDPAGSIEAVNHYPVYMREQWYDTPFYVREGLVGGDVIDGPAVIAEPVATTIVEPGWRAEISANNHLLLRRSTPLPSRTATGTSADPVMLEVFNNLFMSIAEQMGTTLANTSYSVNVKERLDFSCAIFDGNGNLVANAPHMPVHLGSMSDSVRKIIDENRVRMQPGDVYALNSPYNGGTHLPDVTVITPVFDQSGAEVLFYVGSRGHHADIGGITPGSMPSDSVSVDEEGVLIENFHLVGSAGFDEGRFRALLAASRYPARNPDHNVSDIKAQIAANEKGVRDLAEMIDHFGLSVVRAYMQHVQDNAEESVRRVIDKLTSGSFCYRMDGGHQICAAISIDAGTRSAIVDFTGTSDQLPNNFNAPTSVARAAVLYVFRTLVDADIPMNEGCLKPILIQVPPGCMLSPTYPAAVVAGNVETSQAITDTLYGALGVMAAAQGTMNNLTFGNDRYQYYETICGGSGAGPGFNGADAVHTHMTNSRLTDPEVLEWRFPVLLEEFRIRPDSGGAGRFKGGNGTVRRLKFLETMEASILSDHRIVPPYGLDGGQEGATGRNSVVRADGSIDVLNSADRTIIGVGECIIIETPGGGGYGPAKTKS